MAWSVHKALIIIYKLYNASIERPRLIGMTTKTTRRFLFMKSSVKKARQFEETSCQMQRRCFHVHFPHVFLFSCKI